MGRISHLAVGMCVYFGVLLCQLTPVQAHFGWPPQAEPVAIPYEAGFELSEGFWPGNLNRNRSWSVDSGVAQINRPPLRYPRRWEAVLKRFFPPAPEGRQYLMVTRFPARFGQSQASLSFEPNAEEVVFMHFLALPTAANEATPMEFVDADGALLGFSYDEVEGQGTFQAVDAGGAAPEWVSLNTHYDVHPRFREPDAFILITMRIDLQLRTYDVWIDSLPIAFDFGLMSSEEDYFSLISFLGGDNERVAVDQLSVTGVNPLFTDQDKDGLDDSIELLFGLDPTTNDRALDLDGDGRTNLDEIINGKLPNFPDNNEGGSEEFLYVDNVGGSDTNDGSTAVGIGGAQGPVNSLSQAIVNAESGDVIVIMPGSGEYPISEFVDADKDLTFTGPADITFK